MMRSSTEPYRETLVTKGAKHDLQGGGGGGGGGGGAKGGGGGGGATGAARD